MSRNVTILVIILIILLIAGYLLWLRSRFEVPQSQPTPTPVVEVSPTVEPTVASPSASPTQAGSTTSGRTVR